MAVSYISPATYQNQLPTMPMGPLTGFLAGMNQDLANQATQRGFADDDVQRALNLQRLDELQQGQQSRLDVLSAEGAKGKADKGYYDSGQYEAARESENAAKAAENAARAAQANTAEKMANAPLITQFAQEAQDKAATFNPMDQNDMAWWNNWRQTLQGKSLAPNMPYAPDAGDFQKIAQWGAMTQKALANSLQTQQKMMEAAVAPTIAGQTARDVENTRAASNERIEGTKSATQLKVADINSNTKQIVAQTMADRASSEQNHLSFIMNLARRTGWTPELAGQALTAQTEIEMARKSTSIEGIMAMQDPNAQMQLRNQARAMANQTLMNIPGYAAVVKGGNDTSSNDQSSSGGKNDIQSAVEAAGQTYEPDKYEYRVFNGKVQRKPK